MSSKSYTKGEVTSLDITTPNNNSIFFGGIDDVCSCDLDNYNYWSEIIINGTIDVPEVKPSIEEIDSVNVKLQIIRQKVVKTPAIVDLDTGITVPVNNLQNKITTGRKLIIEGLACLSVSYLANGCDSSMHTFHGSIPFSSYIVLPQYPESTSSLDALNLSYNIVSCVESIVVKSFTERNVTLCIPFVLQAKPSGKESQECVSSANPNTPGDCLSDIKPFEPCVKYTDPIIKGICSENKIDNIIKTQYDNLWVEMYVPEILTLPDCKPSVEQILSLTSEVSIMCQKVINTPVACVESYEGLLLTGKKLIIEAILRQRITYTTNNITDDCQAIHSAHFDVPISAFIVLPSYTNIADKFILNTCIEDIFVCSLDDRRIFKNTTIFFKADPISCNV